MPTIKAVALELFAAHGYHGTSLSHIAEKVGIKKQSIYSHFNGKDDLFLQVLKDTLNEEILETRSYIKNHVGTSLHDVLYEILHSYMERFERDAYMKFWLHVSFYPPMHLYDEVNAFIYQYENQTKSLLRPLFQHAINDKVIYESNADIAITAFNSLINAICVELVYDGKQRAEKVMEASWKIYWNGVTKI